MLAEIVFLLKRGTRAAVRLAEKHLNVLGLRLFLDQETGRPNLSQYVHSCRHGLFLVMFCNNAARSSPDHTARHLSTFANFFNKRIQSCTTFNLRLTDLNAYLNMLFVHM